MMRRILLAALVALGATLAAAGYVGTALLNAGTWPR